MNKSVPETTPNQMFYYQTLKVDKNAMYYWDKRKNGLSNVSRTGIKAFLIVARIKGGNWAVVLGLHNQGAQRRVKNILAGTT